MKLPHRIAHIFGYELRSIKKHHPTLASHLGALFNLLQIEAVLDIGANKGQYGRMLRKIGYRGQIFSFEPVRSSFQELITASASDENWHVFNYALGAESVTMDIHVMDASELSSLLTPNDCGKRLYADKIPIRGTETVLVKRLDDVLPQILGDNKYSRLFLKMDTQGYDLNVLRGAAKVLENTVALQSEISVTPLYEGMPDYIESLSMFRTAGFELTGLYPISRVPESLILIEMDCVMRRIG